MSVTPWLTEALAGVMLVTAAYAATRLLTAWSWHRRLHYDVEVTHVLMGAAMAGMLAPALDTGVAGTWEVVFGTLAVWFTWKTALCLVRGDQANGGDAHPHRATHYFSHAVMSYGMLYMYLTPMARPGAAAATAMPAGTGAPSGAVLLSLVLVMVLLASAAFEIDSAHRLFAATLSTTGGGRLWLAPRLGVASHVAMCLTMGYSLILLH